MSSSCGADSSDRFLRHLKIRGGDDTRTEPLRAFQVFEVELVASHLDLRKGLQTLRTLRREHPKIVAEGEGILAFLCASCLATP